MHNESNISINNKFAFKKKYGFYFLGETVARTFSVTLKMIGGAGRRKIKIRK